MDRSLQLEQFDASTRFWRSRCIGGETESGFGTKDDLRRWNQS
jgi:hypothetical protein